MNNLNINKNSSQNNYNLEPVFYCKHCLSLRVRHIQGLNDSEYCDSCGSTNIEETSIEDWENMYKNKFGHNYLEEY